jgi:hypothetical protein
MAADTWGLSWGGSLGSWLTSWSSTFVPPEPEPEVQVQTPAGRKTRKRYYVEIDGQAFDVASASEALQLLERARALAEVAAETKAKKVEARAARAQKPRPIRLAAPTVTASPELQLDLAPIRQDLARIYDSAAALAEMRVLLQRAIDDDEEETLLLLM